MARQKDLKYALEALRRVESIAGRALQAAAVVRDDLTRPGYDEMVALAICYGELAGLVRLIKDTAKSGRELPQ